MTTEKPLLPLDEALAILARALPAPALPALLADRDDPSLDRSSMDGFALRSADGLQRRTVTATLHAGESAEGLRVGPGEAVRIMTGAPMPEGADAVVPVEAAAADEEAMTPLGEVVAGRFVRRRAEQARAGDVLLAAGAPLNAVRAGLMAQVGLPCPWPARVRVGVASTGDELRDDPLPHQIRDANGPMLAALAQALGADARRLPPVPDDPESVAAFLRNLGDVEVLLTSGGVSMGRRDHLPSVLRELGAQILFHRIDLRPGKPTLAALLEGRLVLALPGNPTSSYLNARLFLPVALARLRGLEVPDPWREGRLVEPAPNDDARPLLLPCARGAEGLRPLPSRGSADLVRLAQADACAWIPPGGAPAGPVRWIALP